ncbi:MAG: ABC transporter permease [Gemmatimonadaceae bacterium]|jgi:cell division transport system permease protein|nr:ABC transporter permease [Gemmatimonadaceae bacterium]
MRLALREVWTAFRRSPGLSMLSIVMIAFSLFAFGLFGLVAWNIRGALEKAEERVELRAYLVEGTGTEAIGAAVGDIGAFPEVARVDHVTPQQALERARKELSEFKDVWEPEFLPASLEIRLKPGMREPATVEAVARRLQGYPFVDDVRFGEEWVRKFALVRNAVTWAGIVLGTAFALVSIVLVGATIRMTVLSRAKEIAIMRLVGATDAFVRLPFLIDGLLKGVLGGLLALALTWLAPALVRNVISVTFFPAWLAWSGVAVGAALGLLGAGLSVGRQLRRV